MSPGPMRAASTRAALLTVLRHSAPTVIQATLIPTALFYTAWLTLGAFAGYAMALTWAYGVLLRRLRTGKRVPGILVLGLIGLTVRTALAVSTGSTFVYF